MRSELHQVEYVKAEHKNGESKRETPNHLRIHTCSSLATIYQSAIRGFFFFFIRPFSCLASVLGDF